MPAGANTIGELHSGSSGPALVAKREPLLKIGEAVLPLSAWPHFDTVRRHALA